MIARPFASNQYKDGNPTKLVSTAFPPITNLPSGN